MPEQRPNILFIHCDSMDGRAMGCMQHPYGVTPNLDRLASDGCLFANVYSNNPICCPSRASMMSGLFTHHCEGWNNYKGLEAGAATYRTVLEQAGYQTAEFGKTDYLSGRHSARARVAAWLRATGIGRPTHNQPPPQVFATGARRFRTADWQCAEECLQWLRERDAGRPFHLFCGIRYPHPPFRTTDYWLDQIDPARVTLPAVEESPHPVMTAMIRAKNWRHGTDPDTLRRIRRIYAAMIAEMDAVAGYLLEGLDALGLADSTLVVFASDHGEMAFEHGLFFKSCMYEASVRVPLILRGPGVTAGHRVSALASLVDLYPTFLDVAGMPIAADLDGNSLRPEAQGAAGTRPDWALSENFDGCPAPGTFMLRRGDWKIVVYPGYESQLFNLVEDPDEVHNLAEARPAVAADMAARLRAVVDYEAVTAQVAAYDRASFAAWRETARREGDYRATMARIYSGWDIEDDVVRPWTDRDEERVVAWLQE